MREIGKGWLASKLVRHQAISPKEVAVRNKSIRNGLVVFVIVVLFALICVWTRVKVLQLGYEVSKYKKEVEDLLQEKVVLEVDIARLKSPSRLDKIARAHFGMRPPFGDELIFIEEE